MECQSNSLSAESRKELRRANKSDKHQNLIDCWLLSYFECDWHVELFDNKLSDNKLSDN